MTRFKKFLPAPKPFTDNEVAAVKNLLHTKDVKHSNDVGYDLLVNSLQNRAGRLRQQIPDIETAVDQAVKTALASFGYKELTQENGSVDIAQIVFDAYVMEEERAKSIAPPAGCSR